MANMFRWTEVHGGKTPPPGESVGPHERMSWGRTIGIGAQHVVAMFGATFVFPVVMGLDPNLAILFSGLMTILFLIIVKNWVPSYLGTSAAFVAVVIAIRSQGGDSSDVTGAILAAGAVLALVGVAVHFAGPRLLKKILPPAVTGGVVLLKVLAASASYIAVPAAMRVALPEANPSIYLTLSLGVTFPFNLVLGIPLYVAIARAATGG